jgi:hypothetical protein
MNRTIATRTEAAMTDLEHIDGLFIGQLNEQEMHAFERAVAEGEAYRSYEGGAGFMGLAKVRLRRRAIERAPTGTGEMGLGSDAGPSSVLWSRHEPHRHPTHSRSRPGASPAAWRAIA